MNQYKDELIYIFVSQVDVELEKSIENYYSFLSTLFCNMEMYCKLH